MQGDDGKSRAALHTLSLLESNLPNRAIISELQGTQVLAGTLRSCRALDVREAAVQLLWDINSVVDKSAASVLIVDDLFALMAVLQETREAAVASHALHLLHHAFVKVPAGLTPAQRSEMGKKIVEETCAHKHHLQDAAQYTLGELLGTVLACSSISTADVNAAVEALMTALAGCSEPGQCQVLLTVVSCLAGRQRLRAALAREPMRQMLVQFAQKVDDGRLQARSLSLIKVLNKEDHVGPCAAAEGVSWYFGAEALV